MLHNDDIAKTILATATERGQEKSTCLSEVARMLFAEDWRNHMEKIREVAIELQNQGKLLITQKGNAVNIEKMKGPIRIRIK